MKGILVLSIIVFGMAIGSAYSQDTLRISLKEFIQTGLENSGQVDFAAQNVRLAENRINQARTRRFLPRFELNTQHGAVPGVKSSTSLPRDQYYLDPNLENDWEDWAIYTRADLTAVQPIFSWGALNSAVKAAQAGAEAARYEFEAQKNELELRLFDLYYSYLLTLELDRLLNEAEGQIERIERQIEKKQEEGDPDFNESDLFKFKVFKSEFGMQAAEVRANARFIREVWNYVMQSGESVVHLPAERFLDPVPNKIEELEYYRYQAIDRRSELKGIEAGIEAAEHGVQATKSMNYPTLFLGITGSFANTPNRPRQSNPFIINSTNYASGAVGFGIRQNLDFFSNKTEVQRSRIQYKRAKFLRDAAVDGIMLEINEKYKNASLAESRVQKTDEALVTAKQWLRQEELDYDFGLGDTKDLIDAMKKELELRVQLKQRVFEFNKNLAELYRAAGLSIDALNLNSN